MTEYPAATPRDSSRASIDVVLPALNEVAQIERSVAAIEAALAERGLRPNFIIIDDGSTDATWLRIAAIAEARPGRVSGLRLSRNFGKDHALMHGLRHSRADIAVSMDADGQHPPALILDMLDAWERGADIVNGRKVGNSADGLIRRGFRRLFNSLFSAASKADFEGASDFKLLDAKARDLLGEFGEWHIFYRGLVAWIGLDQVSVPFDPPPSACQSRWGLRKLMQMAVSALIHHSETIIYAVLAMGLIGFLAIAIVMVVLVWFMLSGTDVPAGYPTLVLLIAGNIMLTIMGVAANLLFAKRTMDEVIGRPRGVVCGEVGGIETGERGDEPPTA